jgi:uncharacterized protein (TIGR03437 family)
MKGLRVRIMEFMSIRYFQGGILLAALCCHWAWAQEYNITTVAGTGGTPGFDDGNALLTALLNGPGQLALDSKGNLYIADALNHRIRLLTGGNVTTVAGTGTAGWAGDGAAATSAELNFPEGVAVDASGNIYIADTGNHVIRKVDTTGNITTIAGTGGVVGNIGDSGPALEAQLDRPSAVALDASGNIYIADTGNSEIRKVVGTNIFCVLGCGISGGSLANPNALVVDASGAIYITDSEQHSIVKYGGTPLTLTTLAGSGTINGFSGDGGPATQALLNTPEGLAMDSAGYIYIADTLNGRVRKILKDGTIVTVAGNGIENYTGDGGPATAASLNFPHGLAVDGKGNVYVADNANAVIRLLTPAYPAINAGGVANSASGATTLAPGSLATAYGSYFTPVTAHASAPLPKTLGEVSVTVNGVAAPISYVNPGQVNFQVPWETQTGPANITVAQAGGAGNTVSAPVAASAPGLFLTSAGTAVAQNYPDYSLNTPSNPIAAGGIVIAYLTGIGAVIPSGAIADGAATPASPLFNAAAGCAATIGGIAAPVGFIGLTPGYVGLAQANITVPAGVASGSNPLVVTCNGQASNAAAISVK